jgi:hypothetical protein
VFVYGRDKSIREKGGGLQWRGSVNKTEMRSIGER